VFSEQVRLDEKGSLHWPFVLFYPEAESSDFIQARCTAPPARRLAALARQRHRAAPVQDFHEDTTLEDQLAMVFPRRATYEQLRGQVELPSWDRRRDYFLDNLVVFMANIKGLLIRVDIKVRPCAPLPCAVRRCAA
jgi:hypothetical protein